MDSFPFLFFISSLGQYWRFAGNWSNDHCFANLFTTAAIGLPALAAKDLRGRSCGARGEVAA
jgi:hypothetical protein